MPSVALQFRIVPCAQDGDVFEEAKTQVGHFGLRALGSRLCALEWEGKEIARGDFDEMHSRAHEHHAHCLALRSRWREVYTACMRELSTTELSPKACAARARALADESALAEEASFPTIIGRRA